MKIETLVSNCFSSIIGQSRLVQICTNNALSYARGGKLSSVLFEGQAGLGKTMLFNCYLDALNVGHSFRHKTDSDQSRRYSSPSEFRLVGDEYGQLENAVQNQKTLFLGIDEMSDFKDSPTQQTKRVYNFIKKTLDGNGYSEDNGHAKTIKWDSDTDINVSLHSHAFVCATNFPEKMPDADAMRSRFNQLILDLYQEEELAQILMLMLKAKGINVHENTVGMIARTGRGTARPLERIVTHLENVLIAGEKKTHTLNRGEILDALRILRLYPNGVESHEIIMLSKSVGNGFNPASLAMMTNKEDKAIRKSIAFLQMKEFGFVQSGKFKTTQTGVRYLNAIKDDKFTLPTLAI